MNYWIDVGERIFNIGIVWWAGYIIYINIEHWSAHFGYPIVPKIKKYFNGILGDYKGMK